MKYKIKYLQVRNTDHIPDVEKIHFISVQNKNPNSYKKIAHRYILKYLTTIVFSKYSEYLTKSTLKIWDTT